MRRRLATLVVATVSLVLVAFLIPLALLVQTVAHDRAVTAATTEAQNVVPLVTNLDADSVRVYLEGRAGSPEGAIPITVYRSDGSQLGEQVAASRAVTLAQRDGRSITAETDDGVEVLVSVDGTSDLGDHAVIRAGVSDKQLRDGVLRAWLILGLLGIGLLLISVFVADRLARSLVRDITELADVARTLGDGDLRPRATGSSTPELREVGHALNTLATQIRALIAAERENVADLSHRVRTPLTVLRIDAESLRNSDEAERMSDNVGALERAVDDAIRDARRPQIDAGSCDAATVAAERLRFWSALAEEEGRTVQQEIPRRPVLVGVAAQELEAALDAVLGNVFAHTPDGTTLRMWLRPGADGGAELTIADNGPGFADVDAVLQRGSSGGGSTGLGLDIARRTAERSGGGLRIGNDPAGGAVLRLDLGPPDVS